jgi:rod shape-determining protein MreD
MFARLFGMILAANILTVLPLPTLLNNIRPAWVLLCLLYIQTYIPKYFHVLLVLILGLGLDALLSTPMGEHAFALLVVTWFMVGKIDRFVFFSIMQQMSVIAVACICYQLILYIVDATFGHMTSIFTIFGVAMTTMIFWAPMPLLLQIQGANHVR